MASEIDAKFPSGRIEPLQDLDPTHSAAAKFMLRCASRGKTNLLDFEATSPYNMMHCILLPQSSSFK